MSTDQLKRDGGSGSGEVSDVSQRRRALLKVVAASAGAYAVPLVASFSMNGLRIDRAEALEFPFVLGGNQTSSLPKFGFEPPQTPVIGNQTQFGFFHGLLRKFLPGGFGFPD